MNIANLVCCALSILPFHNRGHHETISADYLSHADTVIQYEIHRPSPPIVVIPDALPGSTVAGEALSSADSPAFWSVVPNQPLNVVVKVPTDLANPDIGVQLFLDGRPVDKSRSQLVIPEIELSATGQNFTSFPFNFACPSPGKHVLQARYLSNNVWSRLSLTLNFQVRFPQRPEIVSVSDTDSRDYGGPLTEDPVKISGTTLRINLAHVSASDSINVYFDGKKVVTANAITGTPAGSCCFEVQIAGLLVPGIHDLTVRAIPGGANCSLASEPSEPVKIHYFVENDYVRKDGKICDPVTTDCNAVQNASVGAALANEKTLYSLVSELAKINYVVEKNYVVKPVQTPKPGAAAPAPTAASSPTETTLFAFVSAAHFPRRAFGPRGQLVELPGALIYEDMKIVCTGEKYFLKFRLGTPSVPTTLHLQFQVQVSDGEPWYTITIPPMHFQPEKDNNKCSDCEDCCRAREVCCRIDSLVLEACNEKICNMRRSGSARFGFGVAGLGQHFAADTK